MCFQLENFQTMQSFRKSSSNQSSNNQPGLSVATPCREYARGLFQPPCILYKVMEHFEAPCAWSKV
jgi:hypothetical protein